ncbi:MAG: helix-turn-helix domain-containing protein [Oscillospiraceae bacterium]|nr:helix-turn-helix domain-containing protein [Oscillospiraceae bacterium]
MGKKTVTLMPRTAGILGTMGEQIKMARLRRRISTELVAERAGISRATLWAVEKGSPSVSVGIYAAVLHSLNGMDKDLLLIAKDDVLGRKLQDLALPTRKRAPKKRGDTDGN